MHNDANIAEYMFLGPKVNFVEKTSLILLSFFFTSSRG